MFIQLLSMMAHCRLRCVELLLKRNTLYTVYFYFYLYNIF